MSDAAHKLDQDYWRPPQTGPRPEAPSPLRPDLICPQCQSEYIVGARYCHVCGHEREPMPGFAGRRWRAMPDLRRIGETLGLTTAALVALVAGLGCVVAAIVTGFMYTASTLLDWQAVQVWRIEWLLAAAAAFLAGILLKQSAKS
jgi:hypothetical protein